MIFVKIAFAGFLWQLYLNDANRIREYEDTFLYTHGPSRSLVMISKFRHQRDTAVLPHLCKFDFKWRTFRNERPEIIIRVPPLPRVQVQWIGFRYIMTRPLPAEVVRCNKRLAILHAPEEDCAFILRKSRFSRNFYIREKICYQKEEAV